MKAFLVRRWFLLLLTLALCTGAIFSARFAPVVNQKWLRDGIVAVVLFLMALPLEARSVWRTIRQPTAALVAIAVNSACIPLLAWGVHGVLDTSLGYGLLIAAATPCTLASASVWTRRAGGNDAIAIVVTVVTNAGCFVLTPFWLWVTTGREVTTSAISFASLGQKLAVLVVLPMVLAQCCRTVPVVREFASRRKLMLGVLAQCGVLTMVFVGSVQMGLTIAKQPAGLLAAQIPLTIFLVLAVHLAAFALGLTLGKRLGLAWEDRVAVGFAGSQKTLMVGLQVSMELGASILPMVAFHVGQLLVDTVLADRLRQSRGEETP